MTFKNKKVKLPFRSKNREKIHVYPLKTHDVRK